MKGCVGLCSKGSLGLITSETRQEVAYGDGTKGVAWVGVHFTNKLCAVGGPWSSRSPRILMDAEMFSLMILAEVPREHDRDCP